MPGMLCLKACRKKGTRCTPAITMLAHRHVPALPGKFVRSLAWPSSGMRRPYVPFRLERGDSAAGRRCVAIACSVPRARDSGRMKGASLAGDACRTPSDIAHTAGTHRSGGGTDGGSRKGPVHARRTRTPTRSDRPAIVHVRRPVPAAAFLATEPAGVLLK